MSLTTLTFAQLQALFATTYASAATIPANTSPGSVLGSISNANAILALNIQGELIYVQGISRLASSYGADVDSFVNPFGVYRLAATYPTGAVTVTTASNVSAQLVVPVGAVFSTANGLLFNVVSDPTNSTGYYNSTLGGYVIASGTSTANVLVTCATAGTIGNVQIGQISQAYSAAGVPSSPGVASVSNAAAFTNGLNAETDAALKARFALYISTGPVATSNAIAAAILGVQAGLTYTIGDGLNALNVATPGYFTVFVNVANSGVAAPSSLLTSVLAACNAVRSAGISCQVLGPSLVTVNTVATCKIAAGYTAASVIAAATANVTAYLNSIGLSPTGAANLAQISEMYVVLRTTPGVSNVTALTLNTGTTDVSAPYGSQIVAGSTTLTPA